MSTGKTVLTRLLFAWLAKGGDFEGGCIARGEVRSESILVQRTALGRRRRERIDADTEEFNSAGRRQDLGDFLTLVARTGSVERRRAIYTLWRLPPYLKL